MTALLDVGLHYDVNHDAYHADMCVEPSLSCSIARIIDADTPLHAWQAHPRLGGGVDEVVSQVKDRGTLIHALLLGSGPKIVRIEADDYKTKKAREERDDARAHGKLPVLAAMLDGALYAAEKLRPRLAVPNPKHEVTAVWRSTGGVLCRGRFDTLSEEIGIIDDLKTTEKISRAVSPWAFEDYGRHIQHAAYVEALETLRPDLAGRVTMRFPVVEIGPPYDIFWAEISGEFRELGQRIWRRSVEKWGHCLRTNDWPGYGDGIHRIEAPPGALARELDRQMAALTPDTDPGF